ncbi:MAG: hypothetical protein HYT40_03810 [Candidatus Sungbacteria bacterium]|uniref:Uncharacterized protein n=1 Tax=Candidatus Sungiibacteriota bacterium TaxID=2750080 RepID=A0A931WPR0_9BACT|nr:hypothetical protein [Candidatus Sungbacteria bacterium]
MEKPESEFGHHEDGLTNLAEIAEEEARVGATNKRGPGRPVTVPETIPSDEPDPLQRLITKEEKDNDEDEQDMAGPDKDEENEPNHLKGKDEPLPLDERLLKPVSESTIVHGGRSLTPQRMEKSETHHGRRGSQKPREKDISRGTIRSKRPLI